MKKYYLLILFIPFLFQSCKNEQADLSNYLSPGNISQLKDSRLYQVSSYDTTGGNNDRINIHAGKTAEIANIDGPGVISRIWFTIDSRDKHFLRRILVRMYWDNEEEPSVEVPIGDFFGSGFKYIHHTPQFVGMSSGGYYCYFPMPFNENARIEIVNQTGEEIFAFYYQIDYHKLENDLPENTAYFHSNWKRDIRTESDDNYVVLDAEGEGQFVGLNFSGQPYNKSLFYLEGDEMIYVDGEDFPSIYGTGLEDYFTSGWYFKTGEFDAAYHGLTLMDSLGRVTAYRHHIMDAIPFKESIKVTLEHGHGNEQAADFSTTAYWYQKEPHKAFEPMKKAGLRIPLQRPVPNGAVEAENLKVTGVSGYEKQDMSDYGSDWSHQNQMTVNGNKGEEFILTIPETIEKEYEISTYFTKGPDYGQVTINYDGKELASFDGYNETIAPAEAVSISGIKPKDGKIDLKFKITGKAEASSGTVTGIDAFVLEPKRTYIPDWKMIGPFANPRESDYLRFGLDSIYPPEKEIDFNASYVGAEGQKVSWQNVSGEKGGYGMSLWNYFKPYEFIVVYAVTYVYSPEEQTVPLMLGSDDGSKVFLNDKQIYRFLDVRIAAPDQDKIDLHLKKGWNKLMVKAENNFGGFGFYARIIDLNDNLKYSTEKEN